MKETVEKAQNAEEFKVEVMNSHGNYSGGNYLDMTAGMFFAE